MGDVRGIAGFPFLRLLEASDGGNYDRAADDAPSGRPQWYGDLRRRVGGERGERQVLGRARVRASSIGDCSSIKKIKSSVKSSPTADVFSLSLFLIIIESRDRDI